MSLTPEKAEIIGALIGDKTRFGFFKRYRKWKRRNPLRGVFEICLGTNPEWGSHLSALTLKAYGLRGCTYALRKPPPRRTEWRFTVSSSRAVRDLSAYLNIGCNARTWRISAALMDASTQTVSGLLRGYMDADGFVHSSNTRGVRVHSVNEAGLRQVSELFSKLEISSRMYLIRTTQVWALQITRQENVLRYRQLVGFSLAHKKRALDSICRRYRPLLVEMPIHTALSAMKTNPLC